MNKGFVMTLGCGCLSEELYSARRRNGTLACYTGHKVTNDRYSKVCLQDITAHVNRSALLRHGEDHGL